MAKPLPRKLDFVCILAEPPKNPAVLATAVFAFAAFLALVGSVMVEETNFWLIGVLRVSAAVLAAVAVLAFSHASGSYDGRAKVQLEVGLDGLRLPMQVVPFRNLVGVNVLASTSSYTTLELLLDDGGTLKLSMLDAEPVARVIRERLQLYKRLTAPRARARADGYRGVRVKEEAESIENALRQEEWADGNLDALLLTALVIPEDTR